MNWGKCRPRCPNALASRRLRLVTAQAPRKDNSRRQPMQPRGIQTQHLTNVRTFVRIALASRESLEQLCHVNIRFLGMSSCDLRSGPLQEIQYDREVTIHLTQLDAA